MIKEVNQLIIDKMLEETEAILGFVGDCSLTKTNEDYYNRKFNLSLGKKGKYIVYCPCNGYKGSAIDVGDEKYAVCPVCGKSVRKSSPNLSKFTILTTPSNVKAITVAMAKEEELMRAEAQAKGRYFSRRQSNDIIMECHFGETRRYYNSNYISKNDLGSKVLLKRFYYVQDAKDYGIDMCRVSIHLSIDENGKPAVESKYDKFVEIVPGVKTAAYKFTKSRGEENIDFFDAFHITKDNLEQDEDVYFYNAMSMIDFCYYNKEFCKRTGFQKMLTHYNSFKTVTHLPENSFFLLYMYLYSEYPVIELLAKMGYASLVMDLVVNICQNTYRRADIKERVSNLSKLLRIGCTKGSQALAVPSYVGSYLLEKGAALNEWLTWSAICEIKPVSKEEFEKILEHEGYLYLNFYNSFCVIPDIMKYGYTIPQILKYVTQQLTAATHLKLITSTNKNMYNIMGYFKDYLEMCELMEVVPTKFPQDIQKAHDDLSASYIARKNEMSDKKLAMIADRFKGYKTTSKYYDIVFPRSIQDFVQEGNDQHNCVGGYHNAVLAGRKIIFFIRKISDKDKSYITAECLPTGLGQLMYRCNTPVRDATEMEYAKAVCKYILSKPWDWAEK